jgi:hypothetical protein
MTSENEKLQISDEFKELMLDVKEANRLGAMKITHFWQTVLGPRLDGVLSSRAIAELALEDSDERIRLVAFQIEWSHWKPSDAAERIYLNVVANDKSERVRRRAIHCLTAILRGSGHEQASRVLANIVADETNSEILRATAYHALTIIQRIPGSRAWMDFPLEKKGKPVELQIDWELIRKFRSERT